MLQASLKVIGGKNDGKLIELRTKKFLVGREQDCQLRPNSDLVSRHHCVFSLDDYALRLRDLGSTNGTLVNGRQIRGETVLTPGDVVKIGKLNLEILIGDAQAESSSPNLPQAANMETTTNATAMDTAHEMPEHTTLEDSGTIAASPSSDTADFRVQVDESDDQSSGNGELPETDTSIDQTTSQPTADPASAESVAQPAQPQNAPQQQPGYPGADPQFMPNGWQYPPYPQYGPQFPQYPPAGYPMAYPPPGYPPGYGYPPQQQPGPYPPQYQQPNMPQQGPPPSEDPGSSAEIAIPEVRLPDPNETGVKNEAPKPASSETAQPSNESTPSQSAANMINSSQRRRRQADE